MQKGIAPILIVLLVAILGIGGYFVYTNYSNNRTTTQVVQSIQTPTPTTDPTVNWKTYTNKTYTISYPSGWNLNVGDLIESTGDKTIGFESPDVRRNVGGYLENGISIGVSAGRDSWPGILGLVSTEDVLWNNQPATLETFNYEGKSMVLTSKFNNITYQMVMGVVPENQLESNKSLFLDIANTLKVK